MSRTTQELLDELRSQLDETNTANATDAQLLAALNRAQRKAVNIVSRKYEDLFWSSTTFTTTGGTRAYDIPAAAHGRKVEMLYVLISEVAYEIKRINNHQKARYITASQTTRPMYYTVVKNQLELFPTPSGSQTIYVCYGDRPEDLVTPQGRINSITSASNYVILDDVGDDLATTTDDFECYVNFIDYNTGEVKGTCQINAINTSTGQVTFKSSGLTRSTVLGKTVSTSLPTDLAVDDYVCLVTGTCVPELPDDYNDFLIQHAVVEIRRRFGEATQEEVAALKEYADELSTMWAGQEARSRVKKVSRNWQTGAGSLRRLLS